MANGSIFHKKLKILFDKEEYQIYHFEKIAGLERIYKVCSPFPRNTLVDTEIIQGKLSFGSFWSLLIWFGPYIPNMFYVVLIWFIFIQFGPTLVSFGIKSGLKE